MPGCDQVFMSLIHTVSFIVFQAEEWVQKTECGGRFCVCIKEHKTATVQIATFALDAQDAAVSTVTG